MPEDMAPDAFASAGARHPVADLLRARREAGSRPGARDDPHTVALVLEGGGMRGVVSAGMTAALERLGLTPCFDLVVGASAGAINGAALLAGVAQHGAATYHGPLASRSFVNPARILRGRPVIDVNRILDFASGGLDEGRHERVLASPIALHCVAIAVDTAQPVDITGMRTKRELWDAILASSRMPLAGGPPVEIDGRRYIDGGMGAPIPVAEAIAAGATHVLALQTRPYGVPRRSASRRRRPADRAPPARAQPGAGLALPRARSPPTRAWSTASRAARSSPGDAPPYVLGLRPPEGTPCVGQLERRAPILARAAAEAERLVERALQAGPGFRPLPAG